jgi:flagellar biosynthesis protein FlhG
MRSPGHDDSRTRVISIGGGKGGVGKSIVASNLALAIANTGAKVVLVDCDLGAANQHVLFGIDRPKPGLQGLLDKKVDTIEEAMSPTAHPNLHLVAGTGASVGAANINHGEKQRLIRRLRAHQTDVMVIDVGAGVSYNVLDFFELGSQRLLVVTPQVTSIQTAYSFLKGAVMRTLHHHAERADELELLVPATKSGENEKVRQILERARDKSPALVDAIERILARFGAQIVGSQVFDNGQAGIFHAISRMIQDFLGITVPILGTVRASRRIRESVNLRKPMMLGPRDEETRAFEQMAEALLAEDVALDDLLDGDMDTMTPVTDPEILMRARPDNAGVPTVPPIPSVTNITTVLAPPPPQPPTAPAPASSGTVSASVSDLPSDGLIDPYARKSPRFEVDWMGSLRGPGGIRPVRIFEVSDGGAVVQSSSPLDIGQELTLVFEQVPTQPHAIVRVSRRTTVGFVLEGVMPALVTTSAAAPPRAPAPTTHRRMAG